MNEKCMPVGKETIESNITTCMNVLDSAVALLNNLNIGTTGTDSNAYKDFQDSCSVHGPGGFLGATRAMLDKAHLIFNMLEEIKNTMY